MRKPKQEAEEAMVKTTVRMPESLVERAKITAIKQKITLQDLVTVAVENYLKQQQGGAR